jgi:sugar phosphate isomerase/epimerase
MRPNQIGAAAGYAVGHFGTKGSYEDYVWCFRRLAELGFHNFNLEILEDEQVEVFTAERLDQFRKLGEEYNIMLPIFTVYYAENDLASLSTDRRRRGLEKFRFAVQAGTRLGSTIMNVASEFPPELVNEYSPEYPHSPASKFSVPRDVSWRSIWDPYVEAIRACTDMAGENGMKLSLEPRANCIASTVDSFLRLVDHVNRPNFGCSLDLVHTQFHREDIGTAIKKLGSLLIDVQLSDADGETVRHLPVGQGRVDFPAVIRALDEISFEGILGVEIFVGDIDKGYLEARTAIENLLKQTSAVHASSLSGNPS